MSFIPAFELGVCNAWIVELLLVTTMFSGNLIDKKASKRFSVIPPYGKPVKTTFIIVKLMTIITFGYSIFLPLRLDTIWFIIGLPICFLALVLSFLVGINFASTPANRPASKGVYRISRNPAYLSIFLIDIGIATISISWIFLLFGSIHLILSNTLIAYEERFCLKKYGIAYQEYMNQTPRWIGIPKSKKTK